MAIVSVEFGRSGFDQIGDMFLNAVPPFPRLIVGATAGVDIEMHAVFGALAFRDSLKQQAGALSDRVDHRGQVVPMLGWNALLVGEVVPAGEPFGGRLEDVAKRSSPESGEGLWIVGVEGHLKGLAHAVTVMKLRLSASRVSVCCAAVGTIPSVHDNPHDQLVGRLVEQGGVVMLIGAPDTGKTTLARQLLAAGIEAHRIAAYIDADVGQTMVGPPACVGLKWVESPGDMKDFSQADDLRFVGSTSPERLVLQEVLATATLVEVARQRADLIIIDTTGAVSGVTGQTLKYHKMEMCRPDVVVALQRGSEMEPTVGLLRRFFSAEVELTTVHPDVIPVSPEERRAHRTERFAEAFAPPLNRFRVKPTVFAPALPTGLDLSRLDGMLVGVHDGTGRCLGLGALAHEDDALRVITNIGEGMKGLRLGSLTIDLETFETARANLSEIMFGMDL